MEPPSCPRCGSPQAKSAVLPPIRKTSKLIVVWFFVSGFIAVLLFPRVLEVFTDETQTNQLAAFFETLLALGSAWLLGGFWPYHSHTRAVLTYNQQLAESRRNSLLCNSCLKDLSSSGSRRMAETPQSVSEEYSDAIDLFDLTGKELQELARQGNIPAKVELGKRYTQNSPVKAGGLFLEAARAGSSDAQLELGELYETASKAALRRMAEENGDADAEAALGERIHNSAKEISDEDMAECVRWYRRAADHGSAKGMLGLAGLYHYGEGVPEDLAEAKRWAQAALSHGEQSAETTLVLIEETHRSKTALAGIDLIPPSDGQARAEAMLSEARAQRRRLGRIFLANSIRLETESIQRMRNSYCSRVNELSPGELEDWRRINHRLQEVIEKGAWALIDASLPKTAVGRGLVGRFNECIERVLKKAEINGVPIEDAFLAPGSDDINRKVKDFTPD